MAKKRKIDASEGNDASTLDVGQSRKRIRNFEDVADSEDEFHVNRDTVLLDESPHAKRRRKWQEQEEFLLSSDEEVLGYSEPEAEEEEHDEEYDEDQKTDPAPRRPGLQGIDSESDEEEDGFEEDEAELRWGTSKQDLYGADAIETEEQALEEEAEALRLQKKQLQSMTAADYGFDETSWQDGPKDPGGAKRQGPGVFTEVLPQLQISEDMSLAERLKLLKTRYPEFQPLSQELLRLCDIHAELVKGVEEAKATDTPEQVSNARTKLRAVSAYIGALTMYFALLTSPASDGKEGVMAMPMNEIRDHPVMDSLVQCRELWQRAQHLPADEPPTQDLTQSMERLPENGTPKVDKGALANDAKSRWVKKSRAQRDAEAAQEAAEARKAQRLQRTEADLAHLDALVARAAPRKPSKASRVPASDGHGANPDVGEEGPLTARDAAEKAKHKKSLRFYISQIAQKANKRTTSGRNAGGDDDIPYRERLKDRQARLNAEAEKRGRRQAEVGTELGGESDDDDIRQAQQIRAANDNEYYDFIASRTAKKKSDKAAGAKAQGQAAAGDGRLTEETIIMPDGKRKISYAIEKNKGLTPHRKKEVRNPRVKKRKKFEEKTKKLRSMKPVYRGGEGRGGYGGELTGIKTGLVKSTKL